MISRRWHRASSALDALDEAGEVFRVKTDGAPEVDGAEFAALDQALDRSRMDVEKIGGLVRRQQRWGVGGRASVAAARGFVGIVVAPVLGSVGALRSLPYGALRVTGPFAGLQPVPALVQHLCPVVEGQLAGSGRSGWATTRHELSCVCVTTKFGSISATDDGMRSEA